LAPHFGLGKTLNIGISTFSGWAGFYDIKPEPEALSALDAGVAALQAASKGSATDLKFTELDWQPYPEFAPAFRTLWMAGAAAIPLTRGQLELVEPLTSWLIDKGKSVPATQLVQALKTLSQFERLMISRLSHFDVVMQPALGTLPPPLGYFSNDDGETNFAQQCQFTPYTAWVNAAGLPAITVPTMWTKPTLAAPQGLPLGIQLVGSPGSEPTLLALAAVIEQARRTSGSLGSNPVLNRQNRPFG
jgi:amidase